MPRTGQADLQPLASVTRSRVTLAVLCILLSQKEGLDRAILALVYCAQAAKLVLIFLTNRYQKGAHQR